MMIPPQTISMNLAMEYHNWGYFDMSYDMHNIFISNFFSPLPFSFQIIPFKGNYISVKATFSLVLVLIQ